MEIKPYPHQRKAIDAARKEFKTNDSTLVVLPTGSGKSIVLAFIVKEAMENYEPLRVLVLCHVKELIQQDREALLQVWPSCDVSGTYCAGLNKKENTQILFASIGSFYKKGFDFDPFDLVIIDEVHMVNTKKMGMYRELLADLKTNMPDMKLLGLTATPFRLGSGVLTQGDTALFNNICHETGIKELTDKGYLAPLVTPRSAIQPDLSKVKKSMGDYVKKELSLIMEAQVTIDALDECIEKGRDRKCWLIFCVSVAHAEMVKRILNSKNITCETVDGKTAKGKRDSLLTSYKKGEIRAMANCGVLTTGFNNPRIDMLICLRPTQSTSLYIQMLGRGARTYKGKKDCLVMDYGRLIETHGPVDQISIKTVYSATEGRKDEVKKTPMKECDKCKRLSPASSQRCVHCGKRFPFSTIINHESTASTKDIFSCPEIINIRKIEYHRHVKDGRNSLKVSYYERPQGLIPKVQEFICFEHGGYARARAERWWRARSGSIVPLTVVEALDKKKELKKPVALKVSKEKKYYRIESYYYV